MTWRKPFSAFAYVPMVEIAGDDESLVLSPSKLAVLWASLHVRTGRTRERAKLLHGVLAPGLPVCKLEACRHIHFGMTAGQARAYVAAHEAILQQTEGRPRRRVFPEGTWINHEFLYRLEVREAADPMTELAALLGEGDAT